MTTQLKNALLPALLAAVTVALVPAVLAEEPLDAERLFALKVYPLLQEKCLGCHGGDEADIKGEFDVRTLESNLRGGESGEPALVPGDAHASIIYQAVMWDGYEMPPKENDRLTPEECEAVRAWIDAGAPWPDEARRLEIRREDWNRPLTDEGVIVTTSGGLADGWTYRRYDPADVWAFQPVEKQSVPAGADHPVDAFVYSKQAEAGVAAADQADPRLLIRRVTFDLIGLPPAPEEIDAFLAAWEEDHDAAWTGLVDRLLASPHYGERQAQHWLDVARYADTGGLSNDYERSNAWRYRDWVIRALNSDMPYNEFVKAQLAGDELAAAGEADESLAVATSFLRMGPWDTAMIPAPEARQIFLDDVVHSVGQTFLSMPLRCCKCHDHKFDPVPTRDYYRVYATFAGSQPAEMPADFGEEENLAGFDEMRQHVQEMLDFAKAGVAELVEKREAAAKKWYEEHELSYKDLDARKNDPDDQKPPRHVGLTVQEQGILKVREQDVWIWTRRLERVEPMIQSVVNAQDNKWTNARKLRAPKKIDKDWRPETFIYSGGSYEAKLDPVTPGVLSGIGLASTREFDMKADPWQIPDSLEGRRLAFAEWVVHPDNGLTTRSIVNRIWQSHFGRGLVGTPNNFGVKGDKPTHPELLDWLAATFVENGWSMKRMHRLIVMSDTYRQATLHPDAEQLAEVDPNNDLLAYFEPRRLTAEEIRDAMLVASGELNRTMGGLPAMPEINMEVALQPRMIQFSLAPAYQPARTPEERNRRSLYAYRVRGQADPMMEVLNLPNPNDSCELRNSAAVTPQAFTLLNSDATLDRAIALAVRVSEEEKSIEARLSRAFELTLGREASPREVERLSQYVSQMTEYHAGTTPQPVTYPTSITRSLVEELSGKPFEYEEWLRSFEDYTPDTKPADVAPPTRALADACLVLLNSNEFIYVY